MKSIKLTITITAPKNKKEGWMNVETEVIKSGKITKLMAVKGANRLLEEAGIELKLDELTMSRK